MNGLLTLILPTHRRPALLARALEYYRAWHCDILVCDSSPEAPVLPASLDLQLLHTPELSFDRKLQRAAERVRTPFVCLSSDDDFLARSGIAEGIRFLQGHSDYVSVQGHYVSFSWRDGRLAIDGQYTSITGLHIDQENPADRMRQSMSPYMHHIYSLQRSSVLAASLAMSPAQNHAPLAEFSTALGGMMAGKHRMLPVFWMARDAERYTVYNDNLGDQATVVFDMGRFLHSPEGLVYRAACASAFAARVGADLDTSRAACDRALDAYVAGRRPQGGPGPGVRSRMRSVVRRLTPAPLRRVRQRLIEHGVLGAHRALPGYPWSDAVAGAEWRQMRAIVLKHGRLGRATAGGPHVPC